MIVSLKERERAIGRGGGEGVSVFAFYSDDSSSNPGESSVEIVVE